MRITRSRLARIALSLLLVLALTPAFARDYLATDGQFTICKWGDLKDCELLDVKREETLKLSEYERKTLKNLRRFAAASTFSGKDLFEAFGKPQQSGKDLGALQLIWFYPEPNNSRQSSFGMSIIENKLSVINFRVPDKFAIFWYIKTESGR